MEARGASERCVIEPRPLLENNIFHPPVKIFVGHPNRRVHLFSAIQLSLMSALSHSEQELTTDLNLSDNKMVELGQGGPRHWRVRPPDVRSPLALVNPVCSVVVVGVVIGERGSEREREPVESMASAPGNMCQNCYPSAAHPIPSITAGGGGRRRASRADPMDCEESQQWGHSFAKCCGSHSREIALGNRPFPAFPKHKCDLL